MRELVKLAAAAILLKTADIAGALSSLGNQSQVDNQMRQHDQWLRQARSLAGNRFYTGPALTPEYIQRRGGIWANPQFRQQIENYTNRALLEAMQGTGIGMPIANASQATTDEQGRPVGTVVQTYRRGQDQPTWTQYQSQKDVPGYTAPIPWYQTPQDARYLGPSNTGVDAITGTNSVAEAIHDSPRMRRERAQAGIAD